MEIEGTTLGTITIDGRTYEHDVIIRLSGEVLKRKKKLSKKYYGTSHILSEDEAKFVFEKGCEQLILGSGQMGNVRLSPEAEVYFRKKGCKVLLQPTPDAIDAFSRSLACWRPRRTLRTTIPRPTLSSRWARSRACCSCSSSPTAPQRRWSRARHAQRSSSIVMVPTTTWPTQSCSRRRAASGSRRSPARSSPRSKAM